MRGNWQSWFSTMILWWVECVVEWTPPLLVERLGQCFTGCLSASQIYFSALHHDLGLSGSLQTPRDRDQDAGARLESCPRRWKLRLHLPSRADQQPVSHRVLQKIRLQHCGN